MSVVCVTCGILSIMSVCLKYMPGRERGERERRERERGGREREERERRERGKREGRERGKREGRERGKTESKEREERGWKGEETGKEKGGREDGWVGDERGKRNTEERSQQAHQSTQQSTAHLFIFTVLSPVTKHCRRKQRHLSHPTLIDPSPNMTCGPTIGHETTVVYSICMHH